MPGRQAQKSIADREYSSHVRKESQISLQTENKDFQFIKMMVCLLPKI